MPEILIAILAVIFVLGVAINIHEFGHFIVAKMFGMRVEAYSFFGLGWRLFGFRWGNTDYRISAIPLGAYVKLYGDETSGALEGKDDSIDPVPASELYSLRPRWQKFLVLIGGPVMNILLSLAIPFFGALMYGVPTMPSPTVGFVKADGAAERAGIKDGDRIVNFAGVENPSWQRINHDALVAPEKPIPVTVERNSQRVDLTITPTKVERSGNVVGDLEFEVAEVVVIESPLSDSPAAKAGLRSGDQIIAVNGASVRGIESFKSLIQDNKNAPLQLTIIRDGQRQEATVTPQTNETGRVMIGANLSNRSRERDKGTVLQAAAFAVDSNLEILRITGKVFGQLFTGQRAVKDAGLAGPVGIVQIITQVVHETGFAGLFPLLALISLNLGVFNLLPIPILDGGQIMVLGIEKVLSWFGQTLSLAMRERIQVVGLAMIFMLFVFTMFLDISRLFTR